MRDGPEQEARDEIFIQSMNGHPVTGPFPSRWTCPSVQPWLYGYDAFKEVATALEEEPYNGEPKQIEEKVRPKHHRKQSSIDRFTTWIKTKAL